MLDDLNELIELLWLEVEDLRGELAKARRESDVSAMYGRPPTQTAEIEWSHLVDRRETMRLMVDEANVAADALWFESQWMRSQLAALAEPS